MWRLTWRGWYRESRKTESCWGSACSS
uniref:Uncharacterized protein n=1 Tax=Rhizophora mucronata TaxID=61149 RepID=A0A2P2NGC2_RHIMU